VNARFDKFEDTNCEPLNDAGEEPDNCFRGAEYFAVIIGNYVGDKSPLTMPPAPAPPLSKRERDTIIRWSQEMPPLER
jgi:hypothetical protein